MTSLAEQFFAAAAGKTAFPFPAPFAAQAIPQLPAAIPAQLRSQVETQVDVLQSFARQAIDSASRVVALNLATTRASVERSTRAAQNLIASRDPRDFLTLGGAAEEQMHSLFSYGRELMSIASSVQPFAPGLASPAEAFQLTAGVQTAGTADTADAAAPVAPAHRAAAEPAELVVVAEPEAVAEQRAIETEPSPVAEQTEIVMAAGQGEPHAGIAPHPASAPVPAEEATIQVQKLAPAQAPASSPAPSSSSSSSSSSPSSSKRRK